MHAGNFTHPVLENLAGALIQKKLHSVGVTSLRRQVKRRLPFLKYSEVTDQACFSCCFKRQYPEKSQSFSRAICKTRLSTLQVLKSFPLLHIFRKKIVEATLAKKTDETAMTAARFSKLWPVMEVGGRMRPWRTNLRTCTRAHMYGYNNQFSLLSHFWGNSPKNWSW